MVIAYVVYFEGVVCVILFFFFFFFNDTATTEIYTLSLHDALPISRVHTVAGQYRPRGWTDWTQRSEEHTSELQSLRHLVCRLLLEKKKKIKIHLSVQKKKEQRKSYNAKITIN